MSEHDPLVLGMVRPQYAPNAEVLVSALLHERLEPSGGVRKLRFLNRDPDSQLEVTAPTTAAECQRMAARLHKLGVRTNGDDGELVSALVSAVTGVGSSKGSAIPPSPMTRSLALAQNLSGVLGSKAPNLGKALETMFQMGDDGQGPRANMADLWLSSAELRKSSEPLLAIIDEVFLENHPGNPFRPRDSSQLTTTPFRGAFPNSPFGWLNASWRKLMAGEWINRLPTRVWTDWATAVLRTGLGFGYLAEMRWYEQVGQALLADEPVDALPLLRNEVLLPWPPSRLPVQSRNVKTEVKQAVNRGMGVLALLNEHLGRSTQSAGLGELNYLRQRKDVRRQVLAAMGGNEPPQAAKNTYETIIYAIQQRSGGTAVDYYGLVKPHGQRYSVVSPGTEWIAVVASLACDLETRETNIGTVMASIRKLGMRPELQEVVAALEAAGMARGSADADHGVRVRSAF